MNRSDYDRVLTYLILAQNPEVVGEMCMTGIGFILLSLFMKWLNPVFSVLYTPLVCLSFASLLWLSVKCFKLVYDSASSFRMLSALTAGVGSYVCLNMIFFMALCCLYEITFNMEQSLIARGFQGFAALLIFSFTGLLIYLVFGWMLVWITNETCVLMKSILLLVFSLLGLAALFWLCYHNRFIGLLYHPYINDYSLFSWMIRPETGVWFGKILPFPWLQELAILLS